jgi:hypothetical protein
MASSRKSALTPYKEQALTPQKPPMVLRSGHKLPQASSMSTVRKAKRSYTKQPLPPPQFTLTSSPVPEDNSPQLVNSLAELLPREEEQDWAQGIENVFFENSDDDEFDYEPFPLRC